MQSILKRFEQEKRKGNETLGKTARAKDEQSDKEEVPGVEQAWLQRQEWLQLESEVLTAWMARGATWN